MIKKEIEKKISLGISIVSHKDSYTIIENHGIWSGFKKHNYDIHVSIIDNYGEKKLKNWCQEMGYSYSLNNSIKGFGHNNNQNFNILNHDKILDRFLIINPDVSINLAKFYLFLDRVHGYEVAGAKVIEPGKNIYCSQKRYFPGLLDPLISLCFGIKLYNRNPNISGITQWIGGSFMLIDANVFKELNGFDERYFMYYEDLDLCKRLSIRGYSTFYDSKFSFYHDARRKGRSIFSNHFFWNISSMIKYFIRFPSFKLVTLLKW